MSHWNSLLQHAAHRPFPLPARAWTLTMRWHDLLFAHWPVPADAVRAAMARNLASARDQWSAAAAAAAAQRQQAGNGPPWPAGLELDTFEGAAWLGVVPFHMTKVTGRWMPSVPGVSAFAELNVRTYVTVGGKPGVFFFSLDAASPLAVWTARRWFKLPYFNSHIHVEPNGESVGYRATRVHDGAARAELAVKYAPAGGIYTAAPGTLEHWLTERYRLYSFSGGNILCGDIHHAPWPLQAARAEISTNTMALAQGIVLPDTPPLLHFVRRLDVLGWAPVNAAAGSEAARR